MKVQIQVKKTLYGVMEIESDTNDRSVAIERAFEQATYQLENWNDDEVAWSLDPELEVLDVLAVW